MSAILICSNDKKLQSLIANNFQDKYKIVLCEDKDSCLNLLYDNVSGDLTNIKVCFFDVDDQENVLDIIEDFHLNYPAVRIIVVGKTIGVELAQDAVRYGADGYLNKPVDKETLLSIIS